MRQRASLFSLLIGLLLVWLNLSFSTAAELSARRVLQDDCPRDDPECRHQDDPPQKNATTLRPSISPLDAPTAAPTKIASVNPTAAAGSPAEPSSAPSAMDPAFVPSNVPSLTSLDPTTFSAEPSVMTTSAPSDSPTTVKPTLEPPTSDATRHGITPLLTVWGLMLGWWLYS